MDDITEQALEAKLLGYLLEYSEEIPEYLPRLSEDDFYHYRDLFQTFQLLYQSDDEELDIVNVHSRTERGDLQDIIRSAPEPSHIESIFNQLKDASRRRKLNQLKVEIDGVLQSKEPVKKHIEDLENNLLEISGEVFSKDSLEKTEDMVSDLIKHLDELRTNKGIIGISTSLTDLDNETSGWEPGELIILGGRPSTGKTDLMLQWALKAAEDGNDTLVFSLEMNKRSILKRILAQMTGIPRQRIRRGKYGKKEYRKKILPIIERLRDLPFSVDDRANTVEEISYKISKKRRQEECDIVFLDYIGLVDTPQIYGGNMQNRYREVSKRLTKLKNDLEIPVIVLSQLNRSLFKRNKKEPRASDLRNTGGLEQDADTVILLHRPAIYDDDYDDLSDTEFIVAKQRHGPQKRISMNYDKFTGRFEDVHY